MKGKIIVIDNTIPETNSLVVKESYVLGHSSNVQISRFKGPDQFNNQLDYNHQRQLSQIISKSGKLTIKDLPKLIKKVNME
jgi:hypothetical protein